MTTNARSSHPVSSSESPKLKTPSFPVSETTKAEAQADALLVQRFNNGDESAFVEMMRRYHGRIYGLAHNLLRNSADAEEITQDTFIRAHRNLAKFRGDCSLATWLYRIALNLSRNRYWYFFRRRRQDSISLEGALSSESDATFADFIPDATANPVQESVTSEFAELISKCMSQLDARHLEILTMRNVLSLSYGEIAKSLHINVGTVKSRIARARESLRALLSQAAPEFGEDSAPSDFFESARPTYGCHQAAFA
ncbi:MAG TPA: sigma-70 family RNA polymerase sigma factor [Opitutaceae bacterium]